VGDDGLLGKIFSAAAGVWALVAMAAVALFKSWPHIMGRFNERYRDVAAEKAGDWERIRHERDVAREERDLVRDRWAQCEADKNMWMARAVKAEATLDGLGEARQEAQRIVSAEREKQRGNGGDNA
jgi:hypothetical protein